MRTPAAVVEALFRDPATAAPAPADRTEPGRPVPQEKRVCAVLPVAAAVAEALAPPRPVEVIFRGCRPKPAGATPTTTSPG